MTHPPSTGLEIAFGSDSEGITIFPQQTIGPTRAMKRWQREADKSRFTTDPETQQHIDEILREGRGYEQVLWALEEDIEDTLFQIETKIKTGEPEFLGHLEFWLKELILNHVRLSVRVQFITDQLTELSPKLTLPSQDLH